MQWISKLDWMITHVISGTGNQALTTNMLSHGIAIVTEPNSIHRIWVLKGISMLKSGTSCTSKHILAEVYGCKFPKS